MSTPAKGQDVSDFQAVQTVSQWKAFDFGFMKASEGTGWKSQTFGTQPNGDPGDWANALTAGIPRGAYHFLHPGEDIASQVDNFLGVIRAAGGLKPGDMLVVDSEVFDNLTGDEVDTATKAFLDALAAKVDTTKHPLIVYTAHYIGQYMKRTAAAYPLLWFAWPNEPAPPPADMIAPWKRYRFWQTGQIKGVDQDVYNGTKSALNTWIGTFAAPTRTITTIVTNGKDSLAKIAAQYGDNPGRVAIRTMLQGSHPRVALYVIRHPKFQAPMPKGIHLLVATGKAA